MAKSDKNVESLAGVKITEKDVVSGRLYLQLINAYKEYDSRQKDLINKQKVRIKELEEQLIKAKAIIDSLDHKDLSVSRTRYRLQKQVVIRDKKNREFRLENIRLKEEIDRLTQLVYKLTDGEYVSKFQYNTMILSELKDKILNSKGVVSIAPENIDIFSDNANFTLQSLPLESLSKMIKGVGESVYGKEVLIYLFIPCNCQISVADFSSLSNFAASLPPDVNAHWGVGYQDADASDIQLAVIYE